MTWTAATPTALATGGELEAAAIRAVRWVFKAQGRSGGELLVDTRGPYPELVASMVDMLRDDPLVCVVEDDGPLDAWEGGPVLSLWPTQDRLNVLCDDARTTAVCLVTPTHELATYWRTSHEPVELS